MTENQQPTILSVNILVGALAGIAILLRVLARRKKKTLLKYDDFTIFAALPFAWSICVCNIVASTYGLGRHIETVSSADIIRYAQTFFTSQILWAVAIPIIKISILLLYTRIFGVMGYFRYTASILGVFSALWGVMVVLVVALTCRPLRYTWDKSGEGQCINAWVFYVVGSGINVLTDIMVLILPLRAVWYLQTSVKQKVLLSGIFLLGSLTCAVSLARWCSLFQIKSMDITWDYTLPTTWSACEACLGIVAGCLPTLAPLLQKHRNSDSSPTDDSSQIHNLQNRRFGRPMTTSKDFVVLHSFPVVKRSTTRLSTLPASSTVELVNLSEVHSNED